MIDGALGEGGGQILRSSLSLSMATGKPFTIDKIRAGRKKPGLMRQHLAAVRAATEICGARTQGAEVGSTALSFEPGPVRTGDYVFNIGSAGSASLVLQTVLVPLALARAPSRVTIQGGTNNLAAPPFEFIDRAFLPLLRRMGYVVEATLIRPGYFPAGGGEIVAEIRAPQERRPLLLMERGALVARKGEAIVSNLSYLIAQREVARLRAALDWPADCLQAITETRATGPGNIVVATIVHEYVTEVCVAFGRIGASAETVASECAEEAKAYLAGVHPVGAHLADQMLLPMALGAGGVFEMGPPSRHFMTNVAVIQAFLGDKIRMTQSDRSYRVTIG